MMYVFPDQQKANAFVRSISFPERDGHLSHFSILRAMLDEVERLTWSVRQQRYMLSQFWKEEYDSIPTS